MELAQWCKDQRGRQQGLSKHLGVKQPVVAAWLSRRRPVPVEHGAAIEAFTGGVVTRQHLFPNDWQRIWPELAGAEAANEAHHAPAAVAAPPANKPQPRQAA